MTNLKGSERNNREKGGADIVDSNSGLRFILEPRDNLRSKPRLEICVELDNLLRIDGRG